MAGGIRRWLEELELGRYGDVFVENDIDPDLLGEISNDDLKDIGVASLGHRKRLLRAIAQLDNNEGGPVNDDADRQSSQRSTVAERRQLTVMFCDLVGSTALSRQLDPEDLREVMRRYQDAVAGAVTRYGGHVAKYLGDGVLAYFGWPQAYEDQAERAVRAGLDAVAAVRDVPIVAGEQLAARVGIGTGLVIVGDLVGESGRDADAVSGETPNLAARLQGLAEPGQVVVGTATHRLIGQRFAVVDLGSHALKGFDDAVQAWAIAGEREAASRFDAAHGAQLTDIVGRDSELQLLLERWRLAESGEGQVVLISGEAGIGKSRLIQGLRDRLAETTHTRIRYQCSPYHANSALYPAIQQLKRGAGFAPEDDDDARLDKLETLLRNAGDGLLEDAPLYANLMSLAYENRYGALSEQPQRIKERLLEALITQLLELAKQRPVLFLFEDAHWIDPTTQELLEKAIGRLQEARVLLIIAHRPEWQSPFTGHNHVTSLQLNRLGRAQGAEIVRAIAGGDILEDVVDRIISRTDGVPLFIEELTKSLVESGFDIAEADIPDTLQASLLARIDQLDSEAKEIVQIGAVIGREFSHRLLASVAGADVEPLEAALDRLVQSELVFRTGTPPEAIYIFRQGLVQDAAYDTLLNSRKRQLHAQIATNLNEQNLEITKVEPEVLAHHYTAAGKWDSAIECWQQAGQKAGRQSANREAAAHFSKGLELISKLPAEADRNALELELQLGLGPSLMPLVGWSAPEVLATYERAQKLCENDTDDPRRFTATWGLWMHYQACADHRQARKLTRQLLEYAADTTPDYALQAEHASWTTMFFTGELAAARDHCAKGLALYDFDAHRDHAFSYAGHDPAVCGYGQGAMMDWLSGYPEQALRKVEQAEALAGRLDHAVSSAHALTMSARFHSLQRDIEATRKSTETCLALAQNINAAMYIGSSNILSGWARVHLGDADRGLELMREGNAQLDAIGQYSARPHYMALLADACMRSGLFDEAEIWLREAIDLVERSDERYMEAELHRLNGALMLARKTADPSGAETKFLLALKVSRMQESKSFELRTAADLAKLWRGQGRKDQARDVLAPIYGWFTEGFDTPDLIAAKALLDELS